MNPLPVSKLGIASHKIRFLFVLSANSERSVKTQMSDLQTYLEQRPETLELSVMGKLAYTLCQRRSFLTWKVAVSAATSSELIHKLSNPDLRPMSAFRAPKISFVFTGQGAQWYAMGRELLKIYPAFASTIQLADKYLQSLGASWSLIGTTRSPEGLHFQISNFAQPSYVKTRRHLLSARHTSANLLVLLFRLPWYAYFHRGVSTQLLLSAIPVARSLLPLLLESCLCTSV